MSVHPCLRCIYYQIASLFKQLLARHVLTAFLVVVHLRAGQALNIKWLERIDILVFVVLVLILPEWRRSDLHLLDVDDRTALLAHDLRLL